MVNDSSTVFSVTLGPQYNDETLYQHCEFEIEPIFPACCIKESRWDFDDSTTVVYAGLADATHAWSTPGIYDVRLTIENYFGLTDYFEQTINMGFTPVVAEFLYNPDPGVLNDPVTFTNITSDPDSRVGTHSNGKYYRWEIYDGDVLAPPTNVYEGNFSLSPVHIFINGPDKCVILYAYWNDGTSDQVSQVTHCVPFQPVADFDKLDTTCSPKYRDASVAGVPPKVYYWWSVLEETPTGWNEVFALEGPDVFEIKYHFPNAGTFRVSHKVQDSGGLEDELFKTYVITDCPCGPEVPPPDTSKQLYAGGGPGVGEKPRIRVKLVDASQEKKKFNIGLTFSFVEEKKET
jgi:hypothetical protein